MEITKVKAQLSIAVEQMTAHLRQVEITFAGLTRSIAERLQRLRGELRARQNELRERVARSRDTIVAANSKITKVKVQLSIAVEQVTAHLRQVQNTFAGLVRNIVDKRQRGRRELCARERKMCELLASSLDAIAVINGDHRFVAANPGALDLFGISETNISKFTIDIFLSRGQIRDLDCNGSPFLGRQERHGKCMIRRLDGSLRFAQFDFFANFVPLLHLCRFTTCTHQRAQVQWIAKFSPESNNIHIPEKA